MTSLPDHHKNADRLSPFLTDVAKAAQRARVRRAHPDGLVGELADHNADLVHALLDGSRDQVYAEAVQVAAIALRLAELGDPTLVGLCQWRINMPLPEQQPSSLAI